MGVVLDGTRLRVREGDTIDQFVKPVEVAGPDSIPTHLTQPSRAIVDDPALVRFLRLAASREYRPGMRR